MVIITMLRCFPVICFKIATFNLKLKHVYVRGRTCTFYIQPDSVRLREVFIVRFQMTWRYFRFCRRKKARRRVCKQAGPTHTPKNDATNATMPQCQRLDRSSCDRLERAKVGRTWTEPTTEVILAAVLDGSSFSLQSTPKKPAWQ